MTPSHYSVVSESGEFTRDIWFYPAMTEDPHQICIFLDAEHYIRDMSGLPTIAALERQDDIPQMSYIFVSHVSGAARHIDYVCNGKYSEFITHDVLNWAKVRVNLQQADHLVCGLSLSGLQSAFIALQHPEIFSYALCQSGSFWWLADKQVSLPSTNARFWLSVGDQETATGVSHPPTGLFQDISQIAGVEAAVDRIRSLGGTVRYNQYSGGHSMIPWRDELREAFRWLLSNTAEQGAAANP